MQKRTRRILAACIVLVAGLIGAWAVILSAPDIGDAKLDIGGPFELVDHLGNPVTEQNFADHYLLVYFGFTFCPDICPTTLQAVSTALDDMGTEATAVQPLFVTIDPERDTPEVMADYVSNFHPRMVGLTGSPEQIAKAAKTFRVHFAKQGQDEDYVMQHSSILFLMDPDGSYLAHLAHDATADDVIRMLNRYL